MTVVTSRMTSSLMSSTSSSGPTYFVHGLVEKLMCCVYINKIQTTTNTHIYKHTQTK